MAFYADEDEFWKCPKHPVKRRRTGVCATCLRDRLITLCPECATTRPCCCDSTTSSSSSSSASSSFFFSRLSGTRHDGFREAGRVSELIENEPAFRRSRSLAVPFIRTRVSRSKINFWSVFKVGKAKRCDLHDDGSNNGLDNGSNKGDDVVSGVTDDYTRMMRSRSVAVGAGVGDGFGPSVAKRRGWYFPSPMKVFRQSKTSKLHMHERSPMHRG